MEILINKRWRAGFLDEALREGTVRIAVRRWKVLGRVLELYFVRQMRLELVWNYIKEIGITGVLRKVASRYSERYRNEKYFCVGIGEIIESAVEGYPVGSQVCFVAPAHPRCVERVVLPKQLVQLLSDEEKWDVDETYIAYSDQAATEVVCANNEGPWWCELAGWHIDSGASVSDVGDKIKELCIGALAVGDYKFKKTSNRNDIREIRSVLSGAGDKNDGRPTACLFGYGNYAKVLILPNIRKQLRICRIHEIDPMQIPPKKMRPDIIYDTSPSMRYDESYDAYFIAGYHHTHAELAAEALRKGSTAIVEKPLVTSEEGYTLIYEAVKEHPGKIFTCYQRRYSKFNDMIKEDLGLEECVPVDYHCIVYDVPNPKRHWYTWPNSRTKVIENMCHWIDHFLFLNRYEEVDRWDVFVSKQGVVNASIELVNGAYFSMVHTEKGSDRIGVTDYIEVRAGGRTARIVRSKAYEAESRARIIRRAKEGRMEVYERMYAGIAKKIVRGEPGDTLRDIRVLNKVLLEMDRAAAASGAFGLMA